MFETLLDLRASVLWTCKSRNFGNLENHAGNIDSARSRPKESFDSIILSDSVENSGDFWKVGKCPTSSRTLTIFDRRSLLTLAAEFGRVPVAIENFIVNGADEKSRTHRLESWICAWQSMVFLHHHCRWYNLNFSSSFEDFMKKNHMKNGSNVEHRWGRHAKYAKCAFLQINYRFLRFHLTLRITAPWLLWLMYRSAIILLPDWPLAHVVWRLMVRCSYAIWVNN